MPASPLSSPCLPERILISQKRWHALTGPTGVGKAWHDTVGVDSSGVAANLPGSPPPAGRPVAVERDWHGAYVPVVGAPGISPDGR